MSESSNIGNIVKRFVWVYLISVLIAIAVVIKIVYIQFFYDTKVTIDDMYKTEEIEPVRGSILSHDGRLLATSLSTYEIRMDTRVVADSIFKADIGKLSSSLSSLFKDKSAKEYQAKITKERKEGNGYLKIGDRLIGYDEVEQIKEFPIFKLGQFKGGLLVKKQTVRTHPYGSLASRTIGYINKAGTGVGIESKYDYKLKGTPGEQKIVRQLGDEWIPVVGEKKTPAIDGYDIQTTIDIDIQEVAEQALREQLALSELLEGGTAIVMEVSTGAIRAIANMKKKSNGEFDESFNYAIGQATEPGSTLKLASLVCLLEDGYVTLDTPIDGGNGEWFYAKSRFSDTKPGGYGELTVKSAFEKSSNVCFSKLVVKHYENKAEEFVSKIHNLKLSEKFDLEIEGEGRATIVSPSDRIWTQVSLPMLGIGYAALLTPLHTLTFYNAIANEGKMVKPYFIDNFSLNGKITDQFTPQVISGSICSKSTVREVKKALRGVVEHGTAARYNDERYLIAGKTGTAQIAFDGVYKDSQGYRKHQASFAGYFPADNPKYTCIVVLYSGKTRSNFYGATWACPVFKKISDKIYVSHPEWSEPIYAKGILPNDNPNIGSGRAKEVSETIAVLPVKDKLPIPGNGWIKIAQNEETGALQANTLEISKNIVPDVSNMGLKEALYILENEGYVVEFTGKGRVAEQIPVAGTELSPKQKVIINLSESK